METVTLWRWQVKQATGRWRLLAWRMTDELASAWMTREAKELRKVAGSAETHRPEPRGGGLMDRLGTLR